jgi:diguanylate cyclase (GGDEF)-like protein/PAS domain S-box-containing protein
MANTIAAHSEERGPTRPSLMGEPNPASGVQPSGRRMTPAYLVYLICSTALVAVLLLLRFGVIARESAWLWVAVLIALPWTSHLVDLLFGRHPTRFWLHARVAVQAATVTTVVYLTGWGPVLSGGFAFVALENVAQGGSRIWRITAIWSMVGITGGQVAIWQGWAPSFLSLSQANALALMGAFIVFFIIRMAGVTMEQKETMMEQKDAAEARVRLSEDRFRSLIQNSSDVTMILDGVGNFRYVSPAVAELLQYEPDELIGLRATDFVHPDDHDRVRQLLGAEFQAASRITSLEFRMTRKDGLTRDVEAVVSNQMDRPSVAGYVANIRDITERKKFEALLAHRALHDPLTGLANRQLILDRADQMLVRARRSCDPVAAFFIDLDNFKDTNDSLGHAAGDLLLQAVAGRLLGLLRASDSVGRLGGDEFVILAEGMSLAAGPEMVAERVRQVLKLPFYIDGFEELPVTVSASIGIASGDRPTADELLRDADIALYRAKGAGRDRSVIFEAKMQSAANDRLALKSDLYSALAHEEFFLLYQPIFDLHNIRLQGVEALIRWQHPTRGTIVPDEFIPVLEDSGLIIDVGRWVLNEACRQGAVWQSNGHAMTMAVNVSMRQLESDVLVDDVRNALSDSGLDPSTLIIEVTESTLMRDPNVTVRRLHRLKKLGVMIAIDDFGTGYSSLAHLRQFPVDILKIDRSFVSDMSGSPDGAALIHTLVELGRTLGLVTLAEGIEEQEQLEGLRSELCESGQGFIFSRPVSPSKIEAMLSNVGPRPVLAMLMAGSQSGSIESQ